MTIFEGARIIELAPPAVSEPLDLAVEGNRIAAVGRGLATRYPAARREEAAPYVSAGLVCGHNHLYSALARGLAVEIAPSKDFVQQLERLWWRLDRALDEGIIRSSALAGAADALMCGVTSVVDHHASPERIDGSLSILKEGFEQVGLRGVLCYETSDRNGEAGARAGIRENLRFAAEVDAQRSRREGGGAMRSRAAGGADSVGSGASEPLVEAAIGAHAGFTLSERTLEALGEAVASSGRGLHVHAAEDRFDAVESRHRHGVDLAARLDRAGCLGSRTIVAHGLYLDEGEIDLLNERGCFLAHNARSNMNNGVGYARLLPRFEKSVLGTDGIGSDMIAEASFAYFKHRDAGGALAPDAFLAMLARGNLLLDAYFGQGARGAEDSPPAGGGSKGVAGPAGDGSDEGGLRFGRVAPGYAADLVFWDYDPPTPLVAENLGGHLLFGMSSRHVHSVMVNGSFVVKKRTPHFDAAGILAASREQTRRLWSRMEERR